MRRTILLAVLAMLVAAPTFAADIYLQQTVQLAGQAPSVLTTFGSASYAFDPMAGVFTPLQMGSPTVSMPTNTAWSSVVSSGESICGLSTDGTVQAWSATSPSSLDWDVAGVADIDIGCGSVWLLYRSGDVEKRDLGTGILQSRWPNAWPDAAKIHVSDPLEQVSLAPIQGNEVRLYDTSGIHLRTLEGTAQIRCSDLALGPGGVLAVADRFSGTVELFSPLGVHLGRIADRGTYDGETLRPASLDWEGETLWVLDPALKRASAFTISNLGGDVLAVPLMIGPGAGSTFEPGAIEFSVLPQHIVLEPDRIELEFSTIDGEFTTRHDLVPQHLTDTLVWRPDFDWQRGTTYRWRVQAYAGDLKSGWSAWSNFDVAPLPQVFALLPNYPNPFNAATVIPFQVPDGETHRARITILNVLGQQVRVLLDGPSTSGPQQVIWDGRNDNGTPVASGIYFVRLSSDQGVLTRKAVLLK